MKTLTNEQIKDLANKHGIEYAGLKAVVEVEASGKGFIGDVPKILYEPHIMHRLLTKKNYITIRNNLMEAHPNLCYPRWGTYKYGAESIQHKRLEIASQFNRDTALESCSWGLGQVMGFHWKSLGYESLQAFINDMYESEAKQLEAMIRFIKVNGLLLALKNKDWVKFARGYNGSGYAKNKYHIKLANAYAKYK
jgi:hypothetical protein